jgi:hypothetical protein
MFTSTKDALVEIASLIRVAKAEGVEAGSKMMFCTVRGTENRFLLTPNECRHLAALLLEDLPLELAAEKKSDDGSVGAAGV